MKNKLKVIYLKVNEKPRLIEIDNTLEAKQKLVDGLIELYPYRKNITIVCNEEGKIRNLKPNIDVKVDYIAGDCFFVGDEDCEFRSLTDKEIKNVLEDIPFIQFRYIPRNYENEM